MVKALDDILIGFFIFFAIERAVKLASIGVVEPWAEKKMYSRKTIEKWKLLTELVALVTAAFVVHKSRSLIARIDRA
jgi:hypothetical protein